MSLRRPSYREALVLLVAAAALAATAIVWTRVVSTISSGSPPASTVQATSIIWRDRVFLSVPELSRWLRSRGATYAAWSRNHPAARDRLEHFTPPPQTATVAVSPKPVAAGPSASSASAAGFPFQSVVVTLLILLAVACAAAASLPEAVLYRFPRLTRTIAPRRDLFLAGSAAILIAVLAAVVLS